jgi:hypothetical protein
LPPPLPVTTVASSRGTLALLFSDGLDTVGGFDPNSQVVPISP